jgi:hypothetical protein
MLLAAAAFAADLTPEEWSRLRAGEVVVHADTSGPSTRSIGWVLIDAPTAELMPEILDFPARVPENATLKEIGVYRRVSPGEFYVRVHMEVFGYGLTFNNKYQCDASGQECRYTLDETVPNDMTECDGRYTVSEAEGKALLVYESSNRMRFQPPGWVRRWLALDAMKGLLAKLKARIER